MKNKIGRLLVQLGYCCGAYMPCYIIERNKVDYTFFFQAFWTIEMIYALIDIYVK